MLRQGVQEANQRAEIRTRRTLLIDSLRRSLDLESFLVDTLGARDPKTIPSKRGGHEIIHRCPMPWGLHKNNDMSGDGSASISDERLVWNCWVCGSGDIFWLTANVLDVTIEEAIGILSGMLQPRELTATQFVSELEELWSSPDQVSLELPSYSPATLRPWRRLSPYLDGRGVSHDTQKAFQTGVDLNNKDVFSRNGVDEWIVRPRVVLPLFDGGILRGWQKRQIDDIKVGAKYKSSPGLPREQLLWGRDMIDPTQEVIVVESPLSVLVMHSMGVTNAVSTMGSEVNLPQVGILARYDRICLAFDGDAAGAHGLQRMEELDHRTTVRVADLPRGMDPADLNRQELEYVLGRALPPVLRGIA